MSRRDPALPFPNTEVDALNTKDCAGNTISVSHASDATCQRLAARLGRGATCDLVDFSAASFKRVAPTWTRPIHAGQPNREASPTQLASSQNP